jgi:glycosyltransferase involved in cell wall biosynthesis
VVVKDCAQAMGKPSARFSSVNDSMRQTDLILWNHRWEYDKCPEDFLRILQCLDARKVSFRLALLGPRGARVPAALQQIRQQFGERILVDGCVSREEYWQWLQCSAVVVSTAIHEFQGLSMLEAASAGVIPLVPDRLCYVEQYTSPYRYPSCTRNGSGAVKDSGSNKQASLLSIDVAAAADIIEQVFAGQLSAFWPADWLAAETVPMWQNWLDSVARVS